MHSVHLRVPLMMRMRTGCRSGRTFSSCHSRMPLRNAQPQVLPLWLFANQRGMPHNSCCD